MNNQTIVCCVVALLLGMLLANMLKNVCGCKLVEGQYCSGNKHELTGDPQDSCLMQGGTWHPAADPPPPPPPPAPGAPCTGVDVWHIGNATDCSECVQARPEMLASPRRFDAAYAACGGGL